MRHPSIHLRWHERRRFRNSQSLTGDNPCQARTAASKRLLAQRSQYSRPRPLDVTEQGRAGANSSESVAGAHSERGSSQRRSSHNPIWATSSLCPLARAICSAAERHRTSARRSSLGRCRVWRNGDRLPPREVENRGYSTDGPKVTLMLFDVSSVSLQVSCEPLQSPLQLWRSQPLSGVAVRVIVVPAANLPVQVGLHWIPPALLVTVPDPVRTIEM